MPASAPWLSEKSTLAPFRVRSFRFQWPADLLTSWAFEMETLILGWYVLVVTDSVLWLTAFASLQFLGTLVAPVFGAGSDRLGRRTMLCVMRGAYTCLGATILTLSLLDILGTWPVFAVALISGLIRPSDLVMRNALIADTIPPVQLLRAMSISRTTMDSARIVGALVGAGLFSLLGIAYAYMVVTLVYSAALLLTLGVSRHQSPSKQQSFFKDLMAGITYVRQTPAVLAIMWLAFLINLTAYPLAMGLLPYIAKDVYLIDENGLGHIVAAYSSGALLGSVFIIVAGGRLRPSRLMLLGACGWYGTMLLLGIITDKSIGMLTLAATGFMQSMAMVSMSVVLLNVTDPAFRGRILGVRILAVYGLPLGLLASGPLITQIGYTNMVTTYCVVGFTACLAVTLHWRQHLWNH